MSVLGREDLEINDILLCHRNGYLSVHMRTSNIDNINEIWQFYLEKGDLLL